jgi:hypothetical protein
VARQPTPEEYLGLAQHIRRKAEPLSNRAAVARRCCTSRSSTKRWLNSPPRNPSGRLLLTRYSDLSREPPSARRPNLVRYHRPAPSGWESDRRGRARAGAAPSGLSPSDAPLRGASARPGSAQRSSLAAADRTDRADGLACDRSQDSGFGVAWASPGFWSRGSLAAPETGVFDDNIWPLHFAASAINACSTDNAARSTRGSCAIPISRHAARSNIQAGSSSQRSVAPPSREQRRTVPSAFSTVSWT